MVECERSDDDDGGGGAEESGPLQMWSAAESSGCGAGNGCAKRARQADRSVLLHGLCAVTVALATARVSPVSAFTAFTVLAECLVGVCVLSPVLRALSCSLFRFSGPCGRRFSEANAIDHGRPRNGGRSVSQRRRPLASPATTTNGGDALPLVKRGVRLLLRVMRGVQRSIVVRPKRSRRSTCRYHGTASRSVTTITARTTVTDTVETVTAIRAGNDYVHCSQRQSLVRTSREQR
ncbi:hypothetical protein QTP88_005651 [Uroleucon formosanum]